MRPSYPVYCCVIIPFTGFEFPADPLEDISDRAREKGVLLGDSVEGARAGVVVLVTILVIVNTNNWRERR